MKNSPPTLDEIDKIFKANREIIIKHVHKKMMKLARKLDKIGGKLETHSFVTV